MARRRPDLLALLREARAALRARPRFSSRISRAAATLIAFTELDPRRADELELVAGAVWHAVGKSAVAAKHALVLVEASIARELGRRHRREQAIYAALARGDTIAATAAGRE